MKVLTPAYGRDYSSAREVKAAFNKGETFTLTGPCGSTYMSIRNCEPGEKVELRYNNLRGLTIGEAPPMADRS